MIQLYQHQEKLISQVKSALISGQKHLICQSPTGSGKTVMFSYISFNAAKKQKKILIITDRVELLLQAGGTVEKFLINPYYIKAGAKTIERSKSTFIAMSQTLRNRIDLPEWKEFIKHRIDLVIIDEAHIQEFNYLFESGLLDDKIVLGFTATPNRSGKMKQLGLDYQKIIHGEPIKNLIKDGYLVNCDIFDCGKPNLEGVVMNYAKGDYAEGAMFKRYDNPVLYKGLVKNYQKIAPGEKTIVFCCNVEHAIKTAIELNDAGITAKFICSGKTEPKYPKSNKPADIERYNEQLKAYNLYKDNFDEFSGSRADVFNGFKNNEFTTLVNVDIATKGYDCPDIKVVVLYRATMSLTLYLQMVGRGGRTAKDKSHFTVLDFGGNKERFGGYDLNRDWSLWHEEGKDGGIPPLKECGVDSKLKQIKGAGNVEKGCRRLILAAMNICPFCGFKYPERNIQQEVELLLANTKDEYGVSLKSKSFKDMSHAELNKYREIKSHKIAWLWRQLWNKGGESELRLFAQNYHWNKNVTERAVTYCKNIN